jgi:ribosomal protein L3
MFLDTWMIVKLQRQHGSEQVVANQGAPNCGLHPEQYLKSAKQQGHLGSGRMLSRWSSIQRPLRYWILELAEMPGS